MVKKRDHPAGCASRPGWVLADAAVGLLLVSVLMVSMSSVLRRQQRAMENLADERAAARAAEAVLIGMQTGQGDPDAAAPEGIEVRPVAVGDGEESGEESGEKSGAALPPGYVWVEVVAGADGRRVSLVGMAPADSVKAWQATRREGEQ